MGFIKDTAKTITHLRHTTMVGPFHKVRCPYCGYESHPGDCKVISTVHRDSNGHPQVLYAPETAPYPQAFAPMLSRVFVKSIGGQTDATELANYQCPHCGSPLPHNITENDCISIAIIGDTGSGKSHYIASIIDQLKRAQLQPTGRYHFMHLNQETDNRFVQNYNPFIRYKRVLLQTQTATETINAPLMYELLTSQPNGVTKRVNLMFYDAAGEDIANQKRMAQYSSYILNASAIILLIDPTSITEAADKLPTHLRPQAPAPRQNADLLNSVIQVCNLHKRSLSGRPLSVPLAITLSKSDLLPFIEPQRKLLLNQHVTYDGRYKRAEQEIVNDEVKRFLTDFNERTLLQASAAFPSLHFFAVSATGCAPDQQGSYPTVMPNRCLDPIMWILYKMHIVDEAL